METLTHVQCNGQTNMINKFPMPTEVISKAKQRMHFLVLPSKVLPSFDEIITGRVMPGNTFFFELPSLI